MKFSVLIAGRGRNKHAACFEDVAKALAESLRRLGHDIYSGDVDYSKRDYGRMVLFGCNNGEWVGEFPKDAIIFNTEQIAAVDNPWNYLSNSPLYADHVVWDYSRSNIETLKQLGIKRPVHCPIGYIGSMTTIVPAEEDVDVLFYGSLNPHRLTILDGLDAAGLKVKRLFGVYGEQRDAWIARSKVVLNMHHYERGVFEIFRVSHLVANRKCVVSELGGTDAELEQVAHDITLSVPYGDLIDACRAMVKNDSDRRQRATEAHAAFKTMDFVASVRRALEQS